MITGDGIYSSNCAINANSSCISIQQRVDKPQNNNVMEFRNIVFNAARDGKLRRLKVFLDHRAREEVQQLVSACTNGATPLVLSCRNGHREVVEYLVERCRANIEQSGSVTFDGETIEGAPPLWCAAAAGHGPIVTLLTESGANVNSTTKTNSTPLRAACFDGHFNIVQFLVKNGADIEVANRHGHTCLMIACYKGHYKIAKYLIDISADVNRKSIKGNTALHDCAESGSLEIMKLLLRNNAKMDVDAYGMTPLLAASVTGHLHVVEYLITQMGLVSRSNKIDALELLGATYVDKKRDMLGSFKLWKRALEERFVQGELNIPKQLQNSPPVLAYDCTVEITNDAQLQEIIADPDQMRMQALLVRERILGPTHPDTSYYIRYRGAVYADMGHFDRCITLWMYALDMQQNMLEPLSPMTQSSLLSFAELFSFMMNDNARSSRSTSSFDPPTVKFSDIMTVFERSVLEVRLGQAVLPSSPSCDRDITYFHRTLVISLHLVCLLTRLSPQLSQTYKLSLKRVIHQFVRLNVKGRLDSPLLHLACCRDSSSVGRYPICTFPSVATIKLLLECGADATAVDSDGNTCLHIIAASAVSFSSFKSATSALLEAGCHADAVNNEGQEYGELLPAGSSSLLRQHFVCSRFKFTSLKCIAARYIRLNNIHIPSYMRNLPGMHDFVCLH